MIEPAATKTDDRLNSDNSNEQTPLRSGAEHSERE
jgi:hypothetical protein